MLIYKEQVESLMLAADKACSEAISYKNQIRFHTSLTRQKHPSFYMDVQILFSPLRIEKYYVNKLLSEEPFFSLQTSVSVSSGFFGGGEN